MVIGTRVEYLIVENWDVFRERKIPQKLLIDWIFAKSRPKEILVLFFSPWKGIFLKSVSLCN